MGGAVSSGKNNDDLIDKLLDADYIKSSLIERVFRAVDRAEYFLPEGRGNAYKDLAWKSGNLHISAPCIYSEVIEGLNLLPGAYFLNIGSGTGYLSTMVGLILGSNGVNHGIEIHGDVIDYANKKLEDFKKFSGAIDEFDFCEPKFVQGNCICLTSETTAFYDRIYCGAACPEEFETHMKNLLKVGGILVMPLKDQLLQIKRLSETEWRSKSLLPVSFASLVMPPEGCPEFVKPIELDPLPLQVLCRALVRNILRKNVEKEHPPVKRPPSTKAPKKKRGLKRMVVPLFDNEDSSEDERDRHVRLGGHRDTNAGRAVFRMDDDRIYSFFLGGSRRGSESRDRCPLDRNRSRQDDNEVMMDTEPTVTEEDSHTSASNESTCHQVEAIIEHHPDPENSVFNGPSNNDNAEDPEICLETIYEISGALAECLERIRQEGPSLERELVDDSNNENGIKEDTDQTESNQNKESTRDIIKTEEVLDEINQKSDLIETDASDSKPSTSNAATVKKNGKREKFDSGLGDEIIEAQDSSDDDDDNAKLYAISSCDEEHVTEKRYKRDSSSDSEEEPKEVESEMRIYQSPYTEYMQNKIQQLPLPPILKRYLNYYRDFDNKKEE